MRSFQIVIGLRGRFPITLCPHASQLAQLLLDELIPHWKAMQRYYEKEVHEKFVSGLPEGHPMRWPHLSKSEQLDLGMDHYWDYVCDRTIRQRGLPLDMYEETIIVQEAQLLYLPPSFFHSSGPHPFELGYSIRAHAYLTPDNAGAGAQGQGKVYDFRGDRQMAPLARFFPASTSARMNMYVYFVWHAYTLYLLDYLLFVDMSKIKLSVKLF
jgi:hypothetical protein